MIQKKSILIPFSILVIVLVITAGCTSQSETSVAKGSGDKKPTGAAQTLATRNTMASVTSAPNTGNAPVGMATALLGSPTDHSVNVNVVTAKNLELFIEYKNSNGTSYLRTSAVTTEAGVPKNIVISGLVADTGYQYHLCYRTVGDTTIQYSPEYSFQTQRRLGSSFVFDVQAAARR